MGGREKKKEKKGGRVNGGERMKKGKKEIGEENEKEGKKKREAEG